MFHSIIHHTTNVNSLFGIVLCLCYLLVAYACNRAINQRNKLRKENGLLQARLVGYEHHIQRLNANMEEGIDDYREERLTHTKRLRAIAKALCSAGEVKADKDGPLLGYIFKRIEDYNKSFSLLRTMDKERNLAFNNMERDMRNSAARLDSLRHQLKTVSDAVYQGMREASKQLDPHARIHSRPMTVREAAAEACNHGTGIDPSTLSATEVSAIMRPSIAQDAKLAAREHYNKSGKLALVKKPDGEIWLHVDAPSGKKAAVNLGLRDSGIVSDALDEVAQPQVIV